MSKTGVSVNTVPLGPQGQQGPNSLQCCGQNKRRLLGIRTPIQSKPREEMKVNLGGGSHIKAHLVHYSIREFGGFQLGLPGTVAL